MNKEAPETHDFNVGRSRALAKEDLFAFAEDPVNKSMSVEEKIKCFTDMVRIRKFEQAALQSYQKGKMGGFLHQAEGTLRVRKPFLKLAANEDCAD